MPMDIDTELLVANPTFLRSVLVWNRAHTMPELREENIELVVEACCANIDRLSASLNACSDTHLHFTISPLAAFDSAICRETLEVAGVMLVYQVGEMGMVVAIPTGPIASKTASSCDDESCTQLESLAEEWETWLLPEAWASDQRTVIAVDDLGAEIEHAAPVDWAKALWLKGSADAEPASGPEVTEDGDASTPEQPETGSGQSEEDSAATGSASDILIVWPVRNPPIPIADTGESVEREQPDVSHDAWNRDGGSIDCMANHSEAVRKLPVKVIVRLAEKKIPVGQLVELAPGALLMFDKPCEDLLDLFVNNQLFCRGEAVKIGEKFGLKINEGRIRAVREEKVIYG